MLWRGVGVCDPRTTVAADWLRRMPVPEPSLLTGVPCTLRLSFSSLLAVGSLPELTRFRFSLRTQRLTVSHYIADETARHGFRKPRTCR